MFDETAFQPRRRCLRRKSESAAFCSLTKEASTSAGCGPAPYPIGDAGAGQRVCRFHRARRGLPSSRYLDTMGVDWRDSGQGSRRAGLLQRRVEIGCVRLATHRHRDAVAARARCAASEYRQRDGGRNAEAWLHDLFSGLRLRKPVDVIEGQLACVSDRRFIFHQIGHIERRRHSAARGHAGFAWNRRYRSSSSKPRLLQINPCIGGHRKKQRSQFVGVTASVLESDPDLRRYSSLYPMRWKNSTEVG